MADTSERIIILSAVILVVIFVRSIQMSSVEPTYEIIFQEGSSISLWVPDKARNESAWITATVLTVDLSPTLEIVGISSEDKDIPRSLFVAVDKALLDAESVHEGRPRSIPGESRRFAMPIYEAESIIRYFGDEIVEGRNAYEFYVRFLDYVISILIQFSIQVTS